MRAKLPDVLEAGRIRTGFFASEKGDGPYGAFQIPAPLAPTVMLKIIAAGAWDPVAKGWEHVSVSTDMRAPLWREMTYIKNLFWREDENVIQFHPPQSEYINMHPFCLHLWKPPFEVPRPPPELIAPMR